MRVLHKTEIQYLDKPLCRGCVYFAYNNRIPEFSKCMRFGEKNLLNGDIDYSFANINRGEYGKCGIDAKYKEVFPTIDI
jgi:hypothetical protein